MEPSTAGGSTSSEAAPARQVNAGKVVYDLGTGRPSEPIDLHVSRDGRVYWSQKGGYLKRGTTTGDLPVIDVGRWERLYNLSMASDANHVYWLDSEYVRRNAKDGGAPEAIQLERDHHGGDIEIGDRYAYVAMWGCAWITRIDKETLAVTDRGLPVTDLDIRNGLTTLIVEGERLLCGAWGSVFVIPSWDAPAERLATSDHRIWAMAATDDAIYWLESPISNLERPFIGRVTRAGGEVELFPSDQLANGVGQRLALDATGRRLLFAHYQSLMAFSIDTGTYEVFVEDRTPTPGLAIHDGFVYWANYNVGERHGAIKRYPLAQGVVQ